VKDIVLTTRKLFVGIGQVHTDSGLYGKRAGSRAQWEDAAIS